VLLSALLTAGVALFAVPGNWNFTTSLLFGAMLSATDPVAVVALLKELGAPATLSVLIESESLLNDGIAYALFLSILDVVAKTDSPTMPMIVGTVIYSSVVGIVVGVVAGVICLRLMAHIWNDSAMEVCLAISLVWGVFLIGDALHASGVLAVVAYGLTFASQSSSYLSPGVQHTMKEVWHLLEYIANTLVFVYSGVVCAYGLYSYELDLLHTGSVLLIYVLLNVIRFIVVLVLYPALQRLGYGLDWKSAALISWSGLRGAVGLVAAIEVSEFPACSATVQSHCLDNRFQEEVMFYMAGIVVLTILVNGTTTKHLVARLGLTKRSQASKLQHEAFVSKLNEAIRSRVSECRNNPELAGADWEVVWSFIPKLSAVGDSNSKPSNRREVVADPSLFLTAHAMQTNVSPSNQDDCLECNEDEAISEIRYRFLNFVKASYKHQFEYGMCGSWPALRLLNEAVAKAQDNLHQPLNEWDATLARYCSVSTSGWLNRCLQGHPSARAHIARGFDIAVSFVKGHEYAEEKIASLAKSLQVYDMICTESQAMVNRARTFISDVQSSYEEVAASIRTGMAISKTLHRTREVLDDMFSKAELDDRDYEHVSEALSEQILKVTQSMGYVEVRKPEDIVRSLPFLTGVDEKMIRLLIKNARLRRFEHGDQMLLRGKTAGNVFLIIRGHVKFELVRESVRQLQQFERQSSGPLAEDSPTAQRRISDLDTRHTGLSHASQSSRRLFSQASSRELQQLQHQIIAHRLCSSEPEADVVQNDGPLSASSFGSHPSPLSSGAKLLRTVGALAGARMKRNSDTDRANPSQECFETGSRPPRRRRNSTTLASDVVEYNYGRGDSVGEMDVLCDTPSVTTVTCTSIVEAYEIERSWLLEIFSQFPTHKLRENLLRQAALQAIEAFFPILGTSPESLRPWLLGKLVVHQPPAHTPVRTQEIGDIIVVLKGALVKIESATLDEPVTAITVYESPKAAQEFAQGTVLVLVPPSAKRLLSTSDHGDHPRLSPSRTNAITRSGSQFQLRHSSSLRDVRGSQRRSFQRRESTASVLTESDELMEDNEFSTTNLALDLVDVSELNK